MNLLAEYILVGVKFLICGSVDTTPIFVAYAIYARRIR